MTLNERVREAVACCGHGAEDMSVCNDCIKEAIERAVAAEREACAQVVQKLMDEIDPWDPDSAKSLARDAIEKIQARGK